MDTSRFDNTRCGEILTAIQARNKDKPAKELTQLPPEAAAILILVFKANVYQLVPALAVSNHPDALEFRSMLTGIFCGLRPELFKPPAPGKPSIYEVMQTQFLQDLRDLRKEGP